MPTETKPIPPVTFAVTRKVATEAAKLLFNRYSFCYHVCEDGKFCGHSLQWSHHDDHHEFVSLADLISGIV